MPRLVDYKRIQQYDRLRFEDHLPRTTAAKEAGVSYSWAKNRDRERGGLPKLGTHKEDRDAIRAFGERPLDVNELSVEAMRARGDFAYFRRRYFGRVDVPWCIDAGERIVDLLDTPHKEFVVINCPPGSGKTSAFTEDLPAWLTVRDRTIRGLLGHRIYSTAETYTALLRRHMERRFPMEAKEHERAKGLATDAEATLPGDFGAFRPPPEQADMWQKGRFVVSQLGEKSIADKEPTWTAFGMDSGSLGYRLDCIVWDDVTNPTLVRSTQSTDVQRQWWDEEAETRLEPGGLLLLVGQRLGPNDIYRYCLDKLGYEDDEIDEDFDVDDAMDLATIVGDEPEVPRKYHHIIYPAHNEQRCEELHGGAAPKRSEWHKLSAPAWPEGCLLSPRRVSWRELSNIRRNSPEQYETVYQQRDVSLSEVLVDPVWVSGGTDRNGFMAPGCWDPERRAGEKPDDLASPWTSILTLDPSVEKYWALQWWIVQWDSGLRYLIDLYNKRMQMGDLIDRDRSGRFFGLAEDVVQQSRRIGAPIEYFVVERNAAHRYLLGNNTWRFWTTQHRIRTVPHDTGINKSDEKLGVQGLLRTVWMHGQVRLPGEWRGDSRVKALKLVDQVTKWPRTTTDDQVMAQWFLEHKLPSLRSVDPANVKRLWRPEFMRKATA